MRAWCIQNEENTILESEEHSAWQGFTANLNASAWCFAQWLKPEQPVSITSGEGPVYIEHMFYKAVNKRKVNSTK
jgi:hypothetical protein